MSQIRESLTHGLLRCAQALDQKFTFTRKKMATYPSFSERKPRKSNNCNDNEHGVSLIDVRGSETNTQEADKMLIELTDIEWNTVGK